MAEAVMRAEIFQLMDSRIVQMSRKDREAMEVVPADRSRNGSFVEVCYIVCCVLHIVCSVLIN